MTTPTPPAPGLLQDCSAGLSKALAGKPDAMLHAREAAQAIGAAPGLVDRDDLVPLMRAFHGKARDELLVGAAADEIERLRAALERIERWHGEFPPTGKTWPESGNPVSYGSQYGSNGERDYMRAVARAALGATK